MRILFIGTVEFSLKALETLISINTNIVGVCTKESSKFNSDFSDLTPICKMNNIAYKIIKDINSIESIRWIRSVQPDIIFCFGWSSLIKKELLDLAPMGVVGYHPSKLPQNRGRHPLIWALVLGLKQSASTFFFMEEGADDGDILSQEEFDILYTDDANIVYNKVIEIGVKQIEEFVPQLENNRYKRVKQDDSLANSWRKRGPLDGIIDFRMSSCAIYNLVRALTKPYIGASLMYKNREIKIWEVEEIKLPIDNINIEYGMVMDIMDNKILVKSYDGIIKILKHEFEVLPETGEYL